MAILPSSLLGESKRWGWCESLYEAVPRSFNTSDFVHYELSISTMTLFKEAGVALRLWDSIQP